MKKRRRRKEERGFIIDVSLVLVLKIILIVFSANDALVSKIMNKRKEINSFRSFNTIYVLEAPRSPTRSTATECAVIIVICYFYLTGNVSKRVPRTLSHSPSTCERLVTCNYLDGQSTLSTPCFRLDPREIPLCGKKTRSHVLVLSVLDYPAIEK